MIISVSRRTDIPAFYSNWFFDQLQSGQVKITNPWNSKQKKIISLRAEEVDCFVFWTRNPSKFMQRIALLSDYQYYFHLAITGYGELLEPNMIETSLAIQSFRNLAKKIGSDRIIWRYDPIIFTNELDINYHEKNFALLSEQLSTYTKTCMISFVDEYQKNRRNLKKIGYQKPSEIMIQELSKKIVNLANRCKIKVFTCAEPYDLSDFGIAPGSCIDCERIALISGKKRKQKKDRNQRPDCRCALSVDIGSYDTCHYDCLYCYANSIRKSTKIQSQIG